jgi:hypothetical protein
VIVPRDCPCKGRAILADSQGVILDAASRVDGYDSSKGLYYLPDATADGDIQAGGLLTKNSGAWHLGGVSQNSPGGRTPIPSPATTPLGTVLVGGGSTLTLAAGDYRADSITVQLGCSLVASGPVRIWCDGAIVLGGDVRPASGRPADLWIVSGGQQDLHLNSQASVIAVIDAPLAKAVLDAPLSGCLVAREAIVNSNGMVHYDTSLAGGCRVPLPVVTPSQEDRACPPSIEKLLVVPNPQQSAADRMVSVKLGCGADRLVMRIYSISGIRLFEWVDTSSHTLRGQWVHEKYPHAVDLPNGTYKVEVIAYKGKAEAKAIGTFMVLR